MAEITIMKTVVVNVITCASCGTAFGIESNLEAGLRQNKATFYCPNGHTQWFGKSEADKLREELKRKEQELADRVQKQLTTERNYFAEVGKVTKLERKLKRVHNGTCPCCKRSFANLAAHMKTKHPEELKKSLK